MMDWEDARVQLIDTPPITADYLEGYLSSMVRASDGCVLVLDLGDDDGPFTAEAVVERLAQVKTVLVGEPPAEAEDPTIEYIRTQLAANKVDTEGAAERLEVVREMFGTRFPIVALDAESGKGLEDLRNAIYRSLNVIRVYSKKPGKPADMAAPFSCPAGSTVAQLLAEKSRAALTRRPPGDGIY
jgi:ribosome-interacting GTPase 1